MSPAKARRFIAYYRVSTDKQGQSGLGLDAQRKAVMDYLNGAHGSWSRSLQRSRAASGRPPRTAESP